MKPLCINIVVFLNLVTPLNATPGATFTRLGNPSGGSYARAVSADGSVVVGNTYEGAFRWTPNTGMVALDFGCAFDVSADGLTIVGYRSIAGIPRSMLWTSDQGVVYLDHTPDSSYSSIAYGISGNGSVVVGGVTLDARSADQPFRWTESEGIIRFGSVLGGRRPLFGIASDTSADGSIVVGFASGINGFRWTKNEGMVELGDLPGGYVGSVANGITSDGSVVIGASNSTFGWEAFRWTSDKGMVGIGDLPGGYGSSARGISDDGAIIVGESNSENHDVAFIWDEEHGIRNLRDMLSEILPPVDKGVLDGWILTNAEAISADGRTIVGYGINPSGKPEAWVVTLQTYVPEPASWTLIIIWSTFSLIARQARCDC